MNCQREGTNLKIEIRIARSMLGMEVEDPMPKTIAELRAERTRLHKLYKEQKNASNVDG